MKTVKMLVCFLIGIATTHASAATITGTVADKQNKIPGVSIIVKGKNTGTISDLYGAFSIEADKGDILVFSFIGYKTQEVVIKNTQKQLHVVLEPYISSLEEVVVKKSKLPAPPPPSAVLSVVDEIYECEEEISLDIDYYSYHPEQGREGYATTEQSSFKEVSLNPLSTFSVDVDAASYSNLRRYINNGGLPPRNAVRVEEMINYFNYDYSQPQGGRPFSINTEYASCPWNKENYLLHIGLKGKEIEMENLPASNIVFLIDVSGSMSSDNKLPLLKTSLKLLVQQLRPEDRVAMVVYAGSSGLVLPSTSGKDKRTIIEALDKLSAGGSTAGGQGLKLAYKVATENFIDGGNNRIILATDGDFNVGASSNSEMESLIKKERDKGIFISVLGYGMGNIQDDKMELIANKGNGNYAYIDNIKEAKKVLVNEFGSTLFTIAKDVKFQLEFNPMYVKKYRLIGYTNRLLNNEDFEDDKKDAGEIGAGHTVTALYEIVPNTKETSNRKLKYQSQELSEQAKSNELVTLKLRYKEPDGEKSQLVEEVVDATPIALENTSHNFKFSAAVAQFGMIVRKDEALPDATWQSTIELAKTAKGEDSEGYRSEMIELMKTAELLSK